MDEWEVIASIVVASLILMAAIIRVILNYRQRWGQVESTGLLRNRIHLSGLVAKDIEITTFLYSNVVPQEGTPLVIFLTPWGRYSRILDQYAVGLTLAGFPVAIINWQQKLPQPLLPFERIIQEISTTIGAEGGTYFIVMYRSIFSECKNLIRITSQIPNLRWILISPSGGNPESIDSIAGRGRDLYLLYALHRCGAIDLQQWQESWQVPDDHVAVFPRGGPNLIHNETVALGKLIAWMRPASTIGEV